MDLLLANRDGVMLAAHEPAESAAPLPLAAIALGPQPRATAPNPYSVGLFHRERLDQWVER